MDDWKRLEKNNPKVALYIFYIKEKYILCPFQKIIGIMKTNNPLIIANQEKESCRYLEVKISSKLLKGITYYGDFYCVSWVYSLRTENKLKSHEKV